VEEKGKTTKSKKATSVKKTASPETDEQKDEKVIDKL